jgi:hypothetical protein
VRVGRKEGCLPRLRHTVEQLLAKLRDAEVALSPGQSVAHVKRLNDLEREHTRLTRAVAALTLDTLILQEAAEGNVSAPRAAGSPWSTAVRRWAAQHAGCAGEGARAVHAAGSAGAAQ